MEKKKDMKQTRDWQCTIAHSPGARDALQGTGERNVNHTKDVWFSSFFFAERFFTYKKALISSNSLFRERGKSYNFCMMPSKIYGNLYDFHSSLYTLVNIIQFLYDGNTFMYKTCANERSICLHGWFQGHTGRVMKNYHKILPILKSQFYSKFHQVWHKKRLCCKEYTFFFLTKMESKNICKLLGIGIVSHKKYD